MRPELRRLEGEALFSMGYADDAKRLLRDSLDEASEKGTALFALRTATSLVRLAEQGLVGVVDPHEWLEEALGKISGDACPDVEPAKSLLVVA